MQCPNCGDSNTHVADSRNSGQEVRRRRECAHCGARFTTYERLQRAGLQVIKRDGRRDDFDPEKLLRSLRLACAKRPIPSGALEKLAGEIESDLHELGRADIPTSAIGDTALARIRELDPVAYVRYASVYRDFDTLEGFIEEVRGFQIEPSSPSESPGQLELIPNAYAVPAKRLGRKGRRPRITQPAVATPAN